MVLDDIVHIDFSQKETSFISDPSVDVYDPVQTGYYNLNEVPNVCNQLNRVAENPFESYVFREQIEKHIADDIMRARREINQETYFDTGSSLAKGRKDHLGNITSTPLSANSFDIIERISICGNKLALFKFKTMNQMGILVHESERWFREEELAGDQGVEKFMLENLQIVNTKAYRKEAIKGIRNIISCKLRSVPLKEYAQFGWNNTDNEYFYFDGLKIKNKNGIPNYFMSHGGESQMKIGEAVLALQNSLKSNPYLQKEMACTFLVSMLSVILSFTLDVGDKVPTVVLYSRGAKSSWKIEMLFKYNREIPTWSNEDICNKEVFYAQHISDDALVIDVVNNKNSSKIKQLSQGRFVNNAKMHTAVFLVQHNLDGIQFYYDWALDIDDIMVDASIGIVLDRLKHEIIMLIEQKRIQIDGLRADKGDLYSLCETFLTWIGKENVYGEYTKPILDILTRGLKALRDFDGDNLITDILRQKLRLFVKTAEKDSCIEKEQAYYIPTVLFDKICEMLSLKPLAAKKALRLRGGLRVYNSTRQEYTVDVTDPVSGMRTKAVAITKSFLRGGEECERN